MREIKRVGIFSLGKTFMFVHLVFGIVFAILFSFFVTILTFEIKLLEILGLTFWIMTFTIFPIIFAIFGFVLGIIIALVYNLSSKIIGGLKIQLGAEEFSIEPDKKSNSLINISNENISTETNNNI